MPTDSPRRRPTSRGRSQFTYHARTIDLLGFRPAVAADATTALEEREAACSVRFPAAVREWYFLDGAADLLAQHSNDDHPIDVPDLGKIVHQAHGGTDHDFVAEGMLPFMWECQHVCLWAVPLSDPETPDDPPVLVADNILRRTIWKPYTDHFSDFVYTQIWDWPPGRFDTSFWASEATLSEHDLAVLEEMFDEREPTTRTWPTLTTHRFSRSDTQRVLIWDDGAKGAQWSIWAADLPLLYDLTRSLWPLGRISASLQPWDQSKHFYDLKDWLTEEHTRLHP